MKDAFVSLEALGIVPWHKGKVREMVDLGDHLWIVTTDRISAYDCVLPEGLTGKGILLNQCSAFWFRGLSRWLPTHYVGVEDAHYPTRYREHEEALRGRWMLVRKAERVPIEAIVRGYLAGSGWQEYRETRTICGRAFPPGLAEFDRLPEPIFTPTTKAEEGHDQAISAEELPDLIGAELAREIERRSLEIYRRASAYARLQGIVIADTKFEFGHIDGRLSLIDEALTPDSSRFWPLASLRERGGPGAGPEAWDKQFVRDYLRTLKWDRTPPAPPLPAEIETEALERYRKACVTLVGSRAEPDWDLLGDLR